MIAGEAAPRLSSRTPTVLITGASSGIGRELARFFARDGFALVLVSRSAKRLAPVVSELREAHEATVTTIPADLGKPEDIERLFSTLTASDVRVDVLVNNAGFGGAGRFSETSLDQELAMIALNVDAVVTLTKRLLPAMLENRRGRILNVASTAAFQPGPFQAVYFATKAFVLSFSEAIAEELRDTGVTVTTLCPGPTETGFAARAGFRSSPMMGARMDARSVAEVAYTATLRGERIVVPGVVNKMHAQAVRLTPRRLLARLAGAAQQKRLGDEETGEKG
ncbi:MAG TPA: SDR family oxidoreductase [Gemmatimonadales bacterium]|nr:SDR family oxidoreductase [Gemmatimonadales bacterium]